MPVDDLGGRFKDLKVERQEGLQFGLRAPAGLRSTVGDRLLKRLKVWVIAFNQG